MEKVLVLGAGRSATSLIAYLLDQAEKFDWQIVVADYALQLAEEKVKQHPKGKAIAFNINDEQQRADEISRADVVISMLPARFHVIVAEACLNFSKHLITASYVSEDMKEMDEQAKEKGLLFLNECGLDPGIDHMSAKKVIDQIREKGFDLRAFESFTGGLLKPNKEEDNPWEYKFTWNPRNVVLAGQGEVKFIQEGRYKYIPYNKLFRRTETIHIPGFGYFDGYANRDSLKYMDVYDLAGIQTLYRGTLRRPGFCKAWDVFVQLGATDDTYQMEAVGKMTHRQFINSFLSYNPHDSVELKLAHYLKLEMDGPEMHKMRWLGLFDDTLVGLQKGSPAQVLEQILKKKWTIGEDEQDQIVMWHLFDYIDNGVHKQVRSAMVADGEDASITAMAKTVGLPLGIATKLILQGNIKARGVQIPITPEFYNPILEELETLGFSFIEEEVIVD